VSLYVILKWLHVLLAIAAVGTNLTYGVWLGRAARDPAVLPFALRGVKVLDDRIANPAYGLLLVTGLAMVYVGSWSLTTPWILIALVLFVVVVLIGALGFTPTLREQIRLAEETGPASPEYQALSRRGTGLGIVLAVLVVVIVFLMVVKPSL
jgi:uncharacterized membrane protein